MRPSIGRKLCTFKKATRSQSVATAHMPGHPVAAQIADRQVTTDAALVEVPIVNLKTAPIIVAIVIAATKSNTDLKLSERERRFGRDGAIVSECRESPKGARDGDER